MTNIPPRLFDARAVRAARARAARLQGDTFLAGDAAEQIALRLYAINRTFHRALDLESRTQSFAALKPLATDWLRTGASGDVAAADALPFPDAHFDLVTSVLSLHATDDLPGALLNIRRVLKPDGVFVAALFAGETLGELRLAFTAAEAETLGGASPRVAPFADVRALGGLLSRAGFALPVADVERTTVHYRDVARLFADLRALGETNTLAARRRNLLSRRTFSALIAEYGARFSDEQGRALATFDIAYLTGWAPHESQQKPLKPGSAKTRLADALGTEEHPTGEKPF